MTGKQFRHCPSRWGFVRIAQGPNFGRSVADPSDFDRSPSSAGEGLPARVEVLDRGAHRDGHTLSSWLSARKAQRAEALQSTAVGNALLGGQPSFRKFPILLAVGMFSKYQRAWTGESCTQESDLRFLNTPAEF